MDLITVNEVSACETASQRLDRRVSGGDTLKIEDVVSELQKALNFLEIDISTDERVRAQRYLETRYIVSQGPGENGGELKDSNIPDWTPRSKPSAEWPFWYRYQKLLKSRVAPTVLQDLDAYTDRILTRLGNPRLEPTGHPDQWDVRGMVAGHVQSGKTSNYIGLICKAADAGYKFIVVLTGIHENLRVQTQERIDEGFIGKKAAGNPKDPHEATGVGRIPIPGVKLPPLAFWGTTQSPGGDFRDANLKGFGVDIRPDLPPVILVVKKNASVLRRLLKWVVGEREQDLPGKLGAYEDRLADVPHFYRTECPLLIIDDEADQASVDTAKGNIDDSGDANPDHDPTSINRLIRSILRCFDRSAYVGYTATPFANILIHDGGVTKTHGDDLFPRNFIINLPTSPTYVGPAAIFGHRSEEDGEHRVVDGLETVLLVEVKDHAANPYDIREKTGWMPPVHGQDHSFPQNAPLPASLTQAILDWTIAGAGLVCRGRGHEHHSMLIHVTRFQHVMDRLTTRVDAYWDDWAARVSNGDPIALRAIRERWDTSFPAAHAAVCKARPHEQSLLTPLTWGDLNAPDADGRTPLQRAVDGVKVIQVHGGATGKPLDYRKGHQLKVIAIGGNKLSRGLTLENLTVSYFLRTSRMYDTLMQMGRWFGYRPGVLDLCRLYMPPDLRAWFEHMADATEELRGEFERMAAQGATPRDFGLRVRSHPVMTVTSNVKMRNGSKILVTFSDTRPESIVFDATPAAITNNWTALEKLVEALGSPDAINPQRGRPGGVDETYRGFLWEKVDALKVIRFLAGLVTPSVATVAHGPRVSQFIEKLTRAGELKEWTIFLRNNQDSTLTLDSLPHGIKVGRSRRLRNPPEKDGKLRGLLRGSTFATKILIDSDYETLDIDAEGYAAALAKKREATKKDAARPGGYVRLIRPSTRGLLLLYNVQPYDPEIRSKPELVEQNITLNPDLPLVGFAVSFPRSEKSERVEYVVGNVYLNEEVQKMRSYEDQEEQDAPAP
ncbi:MAG: Z1 domain-containing protein [Byssovorax sp.]